MPILPYILMFPPPFGSAVIAVRAGVILYDVTRTGYDANGMIARFELLE